MSEPGDPRVAVVMLTHDRLAEVSRSLARVLALPEQPRVVLVDNASADGTAAAVAARFPAVEVVRLAENRGAAGRNAGVACAGAPYVAFCDDDTWWAPGALARAAALLDAHPRLAVVTGRVLVGPEEREDPTCAEMAASPLPRDPALPGHPVLGFLAGASVIRRSAYLEAGGYEPRFFLGFEERLMAVDLAAAGWALAYVPEVVAHHHPSGYRDGPARQRLHLRNGLWFAWLRRPAPVALRATARLGGAAVADPIARAALAEAVAGAGWVWRRRRRVSHVVEARLRLLEAVTPRVA